MNKIKGYQGRAEPLAPCLPHLVVSDTPMSEVERLRGAPRHPAFWILAWAVILLLGVGLTAVTMAKPDEPERSPGVSVRQEAPRPTPVTSTAEGPARPRQGEAHPPLSVPGTPGVGTRQGREPTPESPPL